MVPDPPCLSTQLDSVIPSWFPQGSPGCYLHTWDSSHRRGNAEHCGPLTSKGYGWFASTGKKKGVYAHHMWTVHSPSRCKDVGRPAYTPCRMQHRYRTCPASVYRRRRNNCEAACVNSAQAGDSHTLKVPRDLPWWLSGKESTCQCKGHRFDPPAGKILHAVDQLSPGATSTEPALPRARAPRQISPRTATERSPACRN